MKKLFLLFVLLYSVVICNANSNSREVCFNHVGILEGLPQINILSIYQDEIGAMWFGTAEGLCRYNGVDTQIFTSTSTNKGLTQNTIYSICGNKKGEIYLKSTTNLIKYDLVNQEFQCIRKGDVRAIYAHEGVLIYVSDTLLYQYNDSNQDFSEILKFRDAYGVTCLHTNDNETYWIGAHNGLYILNKNTPQLQIHAIKDVQITTVFVDSRQRYWIGTFDNGVYVLDKHGQIIEHFYHIQNENSLSNNKIRSIIEDNNGNIYIGTFFGLNCFNVLTQKWDNYIHVDNQHNTISQSSIHSLYRDFQGAIWIGTYVGGVNYFNPETNIFYFYRSNITNQNYSSFPFVGKMVEDQSDNLWICTEGEGLNCLDLKSRHLSQFTFKERESKEVNNYHLKCIWYDKDNESLYLGLYNKGLAIFDIKTKRKRFVPNDIEGEVAANNTVALQYYKDRLIVLKGGQLLSFDLKTQKYTSFYNHFKVGDKLPGSFYYTFHIDKKDKLWLSTQSLISLDLKTNQIKRYTYNSQDTKSIGEFSVASILETKSGDMYFGTLGSGIFRYISDEAGFENIALKNQKISNCFCYHISETFSGNLIVLSNKGLLLLDSKDNYKTIFQSSSGFPLSNFFNDSGLFISNNGEVFVGGVNGLISFFESDLKNIQLANHNLYFDKLFINNKQILPNDESKILAKNLTLNPEINLKYNQNNIIIEFASSNYVYNIAREYEYMLEGFDKTWNSLNSNKIVLTYVPPGHYKLIVREISQNADIKSNELIIIIEPPFYATKYAYLLYFLLLCLIVAGIIYFFLWRFKLSATIEMERKEKSQIEKLNQEKFNFFINVSHEFRTPLTLIIEQTKLVLQSFNLNEKINEKIISIQRNATIMSDLANELLDFKKREQGNIKLNLQQVCLSDFLGEIFNLFIDSATKHNINYNFDFCDKQKLVSVDPVQFRKVIYNLLSNAFKYTEDNGKISLKVEEVEDKTHIQVIDDGIGIPEESLPYIFDRFYQVQSGSSGFSLGTGIGLSTVMEIANLHNAEVRVNSVVNKGSIFEVIIADSGLKPYQGETHIVDNRSHEKNVSRKKSLDSVWHTETVNEAKSSVLLVEDHSELLNLLSEVFFPNYNVFTAKNGEIGLKMAREIQPDIIVSDIMMPEMSGTEMCHAIKNDVNISHIPVVLLTSQYTIDQTIEGYMFGADDYIVKPFDMEILLLRCSSLILNRRLIIRNFAKNEHSVFPSEVENEQDNKFIKEASELIKRNFANPDFNMDVLALELAMGRNKLYTKIKELTGLTPNEFTLNIKLHEAARLLENSLHLNVSEIAFQVGFSSTKYFSKNFKTFFGESPLQWRKSKHETSTSI